MTKKRNTQRNNVASGVVKDHDNRPWFQIVLFIAVILQITVIGIMMAGKIQGKSDEKGAPPSLSIFSGWLKAQGKGGVEISIRPIEKTDLWLARADGQEYVLLSGGTRAISGDLIDLTAVGFVPDYGSETALQDTPYTDSLRDRLREKVEVEIAESKRNTVQIKLDTDNSSNEGLLSIGDKTIRKVGVGEDGKLLTQEVKMAQVERLYSSILSKIDKFGVTYQAEGEEKDHIIVFSDYTCGYCRKLHDALPLLSAKGVTVSYLFYPRALAAGAENPHAQVVLDNMKSAWCSDDQKKALDQLYKGKSIESSSCEGREDRLDFPGLQHFILANVMNITATPMTVLSDGSTFVGFSDIAGYLNRAGI